MITQVSKTKQKQNTQERGNSQMIQIKSLSEMCKYSRLLIAIALQKPSDPTPSQVSQLIKMSEYRIRKIFSYPFVFHAAGTQKGSKREELKPDCRFKYPLYQSPTGRLANLCSSVPICKMGATIVSISQDCNGDQIFECYKGWRIDT